MSYVLRFVFFFFNDTPSTEIYTYGHTLSLHDALPISAGVLSAAQKAQTEIRLAAFERMAGHQLVVVTTPSLGGKEIARYATDLASERGIGRRGQDRKSTRLNSSH